MQKRLQQIAGAALNSLGLSKIDDPELVAHLASLDEMEISLRDIEKASNEIFTFFETCNESATANVTATSELTVAYNKDPILKNINSHFKNLSNVCSNKLEKQIRSRIEDTIFAKLEVRREVLASIHKRIEECSQCSASLHLISDNLESLKQEQSGGENKENEQVQELQSKFDSLYRSVVNQKLQIKDDVSSYILNTNQFLCESYFYLGSLNSLVLESMRTALTDGTNKSGYEEPPSTANRESAKVDIKAGMSTIHYLNVKKGEKIWWEAVVEGGDIGFGVLYKKAIKEEEKKEEEKTEVKEEKTEVKEEKTETKEEKEEVAEVNVEKEEKHEEKKEEENIEIEKNIIETVVAIRRVDPTKEDIKGMFECKEDGVLEFGLDNSYSYFRSKTMDSSNTDKQQQERTDAERYEEEVRAFRKETGLAREVQEAYKREALRKCNDLHRALLDCYEQKYFCGTIEKEFWDCYRRERGFKKSRVTAWAYKMHNKVASQDDYTSEVKKDNE